MGVFLFFVSIGYFIGSLPHARGGVSGYAVQRFSVTPSSPRPWGCFFITRGGWYSSDVFPTPVGVFLQTAIFHCPSWGLPHARGGVSTSQKQRSHVCLSSPRPWGCFQETEPEAEAPAVFPTPVGVFPEVAVAVEPVERLPHARGGVSEEDQRELSRGPSSPRPWGCFYDIFRFARLRAVFPTPVGVFLRD